METFSNEDTKKKKLDIPKRYVLVIMGFFGMFNVYAMRVNLSVAMVAMVNQTAIDITANRSHPLVTECPALIRQTKVSTDTTYKGEQYVWNSKDQAHILGSFFYGYIITQLPGGVLSEKFGAKWLFGGGVAITAFLSLLTPLAASWGKGAFIAVRVMEGLGEGVTFPAVNYAVSTWSPKTERSRISTIIFTGSQIGNVVSMPISGMLSSTDLLGGWPSVFYLFGALGLVWFALWTFLMYETPADHPRISEEEYQFIIQNQDPKPKIKSAIPWRAIFTSVPMWSLIFAHFGHNFGFLILLTEMPTYLSTILHYDIKEDGFLSALPYIAQAIAAWLVSFVADKLRESGKLTITSIRKLCNSIGLFGPAACLILITISGCRPQVIIALLTMSLALNGFIYSGFNITHVDMGPDFSGTTFAITNAVSNLSGILGPMVVGYFTATGATIANWNKIFYIAAAIYVICGLVFAIFGSADLQPWGLATDMSKPEVKSTEKKMALVDIRTTR